MDPARLGAAAALTSSLTWAFASTTFAAVARREGAVRVSLARALIVGPAFALLALATVGSPGFENIGARRLGWLALSTLCSFAVGDALFLRAARTIGASRALALASVYPLWTALLGVLVLGEPMTAGRGVGALLCVGGVVALILLRDSFRAAPSENDLPEPSRGAYRAGIALALFVSLAWATNGLAVKSGATGISPLVANAARNLFAGALLATMLLVRRRGAGEAEAARFALHASSWRRLLPAIVADGLFGSLCFLYAYAHADLAVAAPLSSLAPLFALPAALLVGAERFSLARSAAVVATVCGAALIVAQAP